MFSALPYPIPVDKRLISANLFPKSAKSRFYFSLNISKSAKSRYKKSASDPRRRLAHNYFIIIKLCYMKKIV